jgi:hypothetical protein
MVNESVRLAFTCTREKEVAIVPREDETGVALQVS